MAIFKINPDTNKVVQFANIDAMNAVACQWQNATQDQIDDANLQTAKEAKLFELQTIYSNPSTWQITLKYVDSTLTQTSDWLLTKISTTPIFYDDEGNVVKKTFTVEKVFEIIDKINAKGFEILTMKKVITANIQSAQKIENIDIKNEFAKINKIIEIS